MSGELLCNLFFLKHFSLGFWQSPVVTKLRIQSGHGHPVVLISPFSSPKPAERNQEIGHREASFGDTVFLS